MLPAEKKILGALVKRVNVQPGAPESKPNAAVMAALPRGPADCLASRFGGIKWDKVDKTHEIVCLSTFLVNKITF